MRSLLGISARHWMWVVGAIALTACKTSSDGGTEQPPADTPPPVAPMQAAQTGAQRLSWAQYSNAVHDMLGDDIITPPQTAIEPDVIQDGFASVGSSFATISARGVEQYETASFDIAKQALRDPARRAKLVTCMPAGTSDDVCAKSFLDEVGRRAFRRPLQAEEIAAYVSIAAKAAGSLGDFYQGLEFGLSAILQSPNFLFRTAEGEPHPELAGKRRYTGYELAARLSFFLWNSIPDDELLDAAASGALHTDEGLQLQAERLLASPRARAGARNFFGEYLGLSKLDSLSKDPKVFVNFSPDLAPAAREETLRDYESLVFDHEGDYRDIFTTNRTFVNARLAALYHVPSPLDVGFAEVLLPEDGPRRGLLGHASILALYAHPTSSSATLRGKFVRTTLLCGKISNPPVNVNTSLPEPSGTTRTLRERVKEHVVDPGCAGCHNRMDPIGLGLENFDGLGEFRRLDNDAPIDPSGDLDGLAYDDAIGLGQALHDHPNIGPCFVRNMFRYATSFAESESDQGTLDALSYEFASSGYRVKELMLAIVMSPAFRLAGDVQ